MPGKRATLSLVISSLEAGEFSVHHRRKTGSKLPGELVMNFTPHGPVSVAAGNDALTSGAGAKAAQFFAASLLHGEQPGGVRSFTCSSSPLLKALHPPASSKAVTHTVHDAGAKQGIAVTSSHATQSAGNSSLSPSSLRRLMA